MDDASALGVVIGVAYGRMAMVMDRPVALSLFLQVIRRSIILYALRTEPWR
jgi:hypothetical protein